MKKTTETITIEYRKEGRTFQFLLNGTLKETDSNIHKLMTKVKKYKLDWSPPEKNQETQSPPRKNFVDTEVAWKKIIRNNQSDHG